MRRKRGTSNAFDKALRDRWLSAAQGIEAQRAATATTMLMQHIYEGDAELKALRMERDHYKEVAEKALLISPPPVFIREAHTPDQSGEADKTGTGLAEGESGLPEGSS